MNAPQIIHTDGNDELVVLSRRDYDALLARAGDPAAEDAMTRRIVAEGRAAVARGEDVALPERIWSALEAVDACRLHVIRSYRKMTQAELAEASGVAQPHISAIERNQKGVSTDNLRKLATVLRVPMDVLIG